MLNLVFFIIAALIVAMCAYSMVCSFRAIRINTQARQAFIKAGDLASNGDLTMADHYMDVGAALMRYSKHVRRHDLFGRGLTALVDRWERKS